MDTVSAFTARVYEQKFGVSRMIYKMRSRGSVVSLNDEVCDEFLRWRSDEEFNGCDVFHRLLWGPAGEIFHTCWTTGEEPGMSSGIARRVMPEEAIDLISQDNSRREALSSNDAATLERQLQRRFTYSPMQLPPEPMQLADHFSYWGLLVDRAIDIETAMQHGQTDLASVADFEYAVQIVLVERKLDDELFLPKVQTSSVETMLKMLIELETDSIGIRLAVDPQLQSAFKSAVRCTMARSTAILAVAGLFVSLRDISRDISCCRSSCVIRRLSTLMGSALNEHDLSYIESHLAEFAAQINEDSNVTMIQSPMITFATNISGMINSIESTSITPLSRPMKSQSFACNSAMETERAEVAASTVRLPCTPDLQSTHAGNLEAVISVTLPQPHAKVPPAWCASDEWITSVDLAKLLKIDPRSICSYRKRATHNGEDEHGRWGVDSVGYFRRTVCGQQAAYHIPSLNPKYEYRYKKAISSGDRMGIISSSP